MLREWMRRNGLSGWGLDLDDTLLRVGPIFFHHLDLCNAYLGKLGYGDTRALVMAANNRAYYTRGVNPGRWVDVMNEVSEELDLPAGVVHNALGILGGIYRTVPTWIPGARAFLACLLREKIPFIIVTHADEEWTRWKYKVTGAERWGLPERTYIVDEDGPKGPEQWGEALSHLPIDDPKKVAIGGDSPASDILPTWQLVGCHFLVGNNPWVTQHGQVPEGVIRVENPGQILSHCLGRTRSAPYALVHNRV